MPRSASSNMESVSSARSSMSTSRERSNDSDQGHKTKAQNRLNKRLEEGKAIRNKDCAGVEDTISQDRIPKKYAIYIDKQCYDARHLWTWAKTNRTVPHTRRVLTDQEMELITKKGKGYKFPNALATSLDDPRLQEMFFNMTLKEFILQKSYNFLRPFMGILGNMKKSELYSRYGLYEDDFTPVEPLEVSLVAYKHFANVNVILIIRCNFHNHLGSDSGWLSIVITDLYGRYNWRHVGTRDSAIAELDETFLAKDRTFKLLELDRLPLPLPPQEGGNAKHQGRNYKVHIGKLGGKYIMVSGKKIYLRTSSL